MPIENSGNSFFSDLIHTLRSWMNADRIRIARNEGRSLRLQVGHRLMIGNRCFTIQNLTVSEELNSQRSQRVVYQICDDESEGVGTSSDTLEVTIPDHGSTVPHILLRHGTLETQISENEITIQ